MKTPQLERMWEMFIRIGSPERILACAHLEVLIKQVRPVVLNLISRDLITWYSFLIHGRNSVPTSDDDMFWHLRISIVAGIDPDQVLALLPNYCEMTRQIDPKSPAKISGIDESILSGRDITEAWRIIGEQSEWFLGMLSIYESGLPGSRLFPDVVQYLHFFPTWHKQRSTNYECGTDSTSNTLTVSER